MKSVGRPARSAPGSVAQIESELDEGAAMLSKRSWGAPKRLWVSAAGAGSGVPGMGSDHSPACSGIRGHGGVPARGGKSGRLGPVATGGCKGGLSLWWKPLTVAAMSISMQGAGFRTRWMRTRFPFRYGIAAMTELPHVFLEVELRVDGKTCRGLASEGLPPKWFTKDPQTTFEEDLPLMLEVLEHAVAAARGIEAESVFGFWQALYDVQDAWGRERGVPPLLGHLGTSLVERAVIDAWCRGRGETFAGALRSGGLGVDPGALHPELSGSQVADWLPGEPCGSIIARHTVGLGDPLFPEDITDEDRADDCLPQALSDAIDCYGLTHFKVKICGKLEVDIPRLIAIAKLLAEKVPGYRFTLDGNEQYHDLGAFREHWEAFGKEEALADFLAPAHLIFVEQPLFRDVALAPGLKDELDGWDAAPPMIIDESDAECDSLRRALALGYRGTSHKNCKGVFKGVANRCLLEWYRREHSADGPWVMSGEDLANVGPVALLNDLAAMAAMGIDDVERNGHHYFAGLSMFPEPVREQVVARHPDLYGESGDAWPTLRIGDGRLAVGSVNAAGFGCGLPLDEGVLRGLGETGLPVVD